MPKATAGIVSSRGCGEYAHKGGEGPRACLAAPMTAVLHGLPHGWVPCLTHTGRVYFADHNSRETFWDLPENYSWGPDPAAVIAASMRA